MYFFYLVAELLGIDAKELQESLTTSGMVARGETIVKNNRYVPFLTLPYPTATYPSLPHIKELQESRMTSGMVACGETIVKNNTYVPFHAIPLYPTIPLPTYPTLTYRYVSHPTHIKELQESLTTSCMVARGGTIKNNRYAPYPVPSLRTLPYSNLRYPTQPNPTYPTHVKELQELLTTPIVVAHGETIVKNNDNT